MDFGQILFVLAPAVLGLVAVALGFSLLRPARGESGTTPARTIGGILLVLIAMGCALVSFALWFCIKAFSGPMH